MAEQEYYRLQLRYDTLENWRRVNPVLYVSECAFITDQNRIKIGDGHTTFNDLPYLSEEEFNQILQEIKNSKITIKQNGNIAGEFTLNQSEDAEINLTSTAPLHTINTLKKINSWLYEISLSQEYDYDWAKNYFDTHYLSSSGCSSFRLGNIYGRNLDWLYSDDIEFIIRTEKLGNRHSSIGCTTSIPELTREIIESKEDNELYKLVPFRLVDGINESGLFCNTNVISNKDTQIHTTGTRPRIEEREKICMLMLCRYIIDNFDSALSAIEYIRDYVSVYAPSNYDYEMHYMIGDETDTYILEFINNQLVYNICSDSVPSIMTNFIINGTSITTTGINWNSVSDFGSGLERYDLIYSNLGHISSPQTALSLMSRELKYTNTYTLKNWLTEFTGYGNLTVRDAINNPSSFTPYINAASDMYNNRSRDPESPYYGTWQTNHTSIYDISQKSLIIRTQEIDDYTYTISLTTIPDFPDIPTKTSDLINDSGFISSQNIITKTQTSDSLIVVENTVYKYSNPLTNLSISSIPNSEMESNIYFSTSSAGFNLTIPANVKRFGDLELLGNSNFVIAIKGNYIVIAKTDN